MEHWKPIKNYEQQYQISDMGRVKSLKKKIRIMKPTIAQSGRLFITLRKKGKQETKYIHVLVLEAFICEKPDGAVACFNNMNVQDCRLSNLRWDEKQNETIDRIKRGTHTCGEKAPKSKLGNNQVKIIKKMLSEGHKQCDIAKKFNINQSTVSDIKTGQSWKHLCFLS